MTEERTAFIEVFPDFARRVAADFNLMPEDIGLADDTEALKAFAAEQCGATRRDGAVTAPIG